MKTMMHGWETNKLAFISIALCLLELAIFMSVIAVLTATHVPINHSLLARQITGITWLFAGPISVGFAGASLFLDARRGVALVALALAIVSWGFCTLQILV